MQPGLVSYLLGLVHLDFLTLGGKWMIVKALMSLLLQITSLNMGKHM